MSIESTSQVTAEARKTDSAVDSPIEIDTELPRRDETFHRRLPEIIARAHRAPPAIPEPKRPRPPIPPPLLPRTPSRTSAEPASALAAQLQPSRPKRSAAMASIDSRATADIVGDRQRALEPILNPSPLYPAEAVRNRWQGKVLLRLRVSALGIVEAVTVVSSTGMSILDEAAVAAVRHWRFRPAQRGDRPIAATVLVPVVFELTGELQAQS